MISSSTVSWSAHLGGAVAGLTFGICVLKNFRQMPWEGCLWKVLKVLWPILKLQLSCTIFTLILTFAVLWNIFWPGYSVGEGLEDFNELNKTELVDMWKKEVLNRTDQLLDDLSQS